MNSYKYAIVIGASSGIGREIALQLAQAGCHVAALGRREDRLRELEALRPDRIRTYVHDVTNYRQVPALFQQITGDLGGLDLVVYAAGTMPAVALNEFDFEKDRTMVEVNLLGAIAWLNQAAIRFQGAQHGTIVGIGSVAGDRGRAGQPVYNTTKAALATYLEALRNRLSRHGVRVVTVKPGPVDTEMTAGLGRAGMMSATEAARRILTKSHHTGEHYLKLSHRILFFVIRNIPSWIFRRTKL